MSALIQNFDTVEKVIETSADSAGSALKENERYLDSIQGKIDQFNNAMQAMWSNTLDSDWVKLIVEAGTGLIKIIDSVGLLQTALFGLFTYLSNKKDGNFDLASILGIHDKEKGWTIGQEGFTGWIKEAPGKMKGKFKKKSVVEDVVGNPEDIEIDAKEYAEAISENINDYVKIDTSQMDTQIEDIQNKLMIAREQLDDAKSKDWNYYKSFGSVTPAKDRDNRIAEKQKEISSLEQRLSDLQTKRSEVMSNAALQYAETNINNAKEEAQAQRSLFEVLGKVKGVKLSMGNEQDAALKIDQINQAASQGQVALSQYAATLGDGDMALQAYIASLNGEKASLSGFNAFIQQHNAGVKASGVAAKAAAIGHAALNAAISMGLSFLIQFGIEAIMKLIQLFKDWISPTQKLTEELNDLKSELQDIRSELESVNSELETTNKRMAELLAKDTLTFEEQEELDRLRATNDELERRKELLKDEEESKSGIVGRKAARVVDSAKDDYGFWESATPVWHYFKTTAEEDANKNIEDYKKIKEKMDNASSLKEREKYQKKLDKEAEKIDEYIMTLSEALDGVEYGDSEESDKALDYLAEIQDKYGIARGSASAKTNAVKGLFNKDEFVETKAAIDGYVNALAKGDTSADDSIANIINSNKDLVQDLEARGLKAQDAIDYFTKLGSEANYATLDGKIAEVSKAAANFEKLIKGGTFKVDGVDTGLADLFDEEGKIIQTKLSQVFQDTSDQTREDITHLLEGSYNQIKNGTVDVERLLSGFGLKTAQQVLEIQNKVLGEQNLELFPNLKEEIDGIIDKFSEFSAAVGSVVDAMDTLEQARAEEAYSGSVSIETLENLMKYTDDYSQLVEIDETGAIRLAADAEKILIEQRIQKIKTDAAAAVQTAQTNLEQAKYNAKAVNETGPVQEALTSATDGLAGAWAYLGSIIGDITDGNFSGIFERASAAYGNVTAGREEKRAQVNVSVEDAEVALANALNQQKIANALTADNVKSKHSADEASGGNATKEDAEKDLIEDGWEKLLAKYENQLALLSNERDLIQAEIDKAEAQGGKASAQYYDDLINNSVAEKKLLEEKKVALEEYLATNAGAIDQDTWTDYNNEINETAVAIKECEINTIEWAEAIREIDTHYFEQATDEISRLGEELEFVNSLLEDEEIADENGNWSSAALTRMGLYTQQMEKAATEAAMYQDEINDLNEEYDNGTLSEEQYQEKLSGLVSGQQDAIQSYEDAKDSIVEMNEARIDAIREGIEKEIEAYGDLIDAKKEELDAERDLHDFRENIKDQTKDIASLERRIAALSGSSAASDVAERRKLEAQLLEAKEGLNDTYYGHSREAQSAALDEEAEAYTLSKERYIEQLEEQLKDTETLIQNSIMDVMLNADTVYTELNELADLYGVDLSDSLTLPWKNASTQAIKWKDELKESMTAGEYASLIGEGGAITGFANGVATKLKGSWTTAQTAAKNYAGYLTGAELKNRFTNTLTGFGSQIQGIIDKWNGVRKAADDAYAAQTRKVTVGGTGAETGGGSGDNKTPTYTPSPAPTPTPEPTIKLRGLMKTSREMILGPKSFVDENTETINGTKYYRDSKTGYYYKISDLNSNRKYDGGRTTGWAIPKGTWFYTKHAKGTIETTRDEWAITDEPQFGDELVLVPGRDGNLSFMRKGTGVVPADLTQKLFELAQIPTSDLMNKNLTAIVPNITKNDFKNEFNFESLVHVDTVDSDTLPKLEKMVDKKIDDFGKALNYSLKRFAR